MPTPSDLFVLGLSHRTAPLDLRERLAFEEARIPEDLRAIVELPNVGEAVIVSTCNRVEIYAGVSDAAVAGPILRRSLAKRHGIDADHLDEHLYERSGDEGVRHLFRVASSLDSMVVGEPQITGQMKAAFARAVEAGTVGSVLQRCMHRALAVAKKVRSDTAIGRESVSVSSVAVDLARKIFGDLGQRPVLLVGAGEMSELALRKLRADGVPEILVANRSMEKAETLAQEFGGRARDLAHLGELLVEADIVFASTAARTFLIGPEAVANAMHARRNRPLFLIDTAVPRNIDPRVNDVDNVYLYDMDDLQRVVASNQAERQREASVAERLVESEVVAFADWRRTLSVVPTVVDLRTRLHGIQENETERLIRRLEASRPSGTPLPANERALIESLGRNIINKVLHGPTTALKRATTPSAELADAPGPTDLVATTRALFALDDADEEDQERAGSSAQLEPTPEPTTE